MTRPASPGASVKLPVLLHAECTIMAAEMGFRNVGQWMERAASLQLAADREAQKAKRFNADYRAAERDNNLSMPSPRDYGLAPDFHLPKAPAPSRQAPLKPFSR